MHRLSKTQQNEIKNYIAQVIQEKSLHLDTKILLIGMAISLSTFHFSQILEKVNVIAPKICLPLKSINALVTNTLAIETILNIISKKVIVLDSSELEEKLLSIKALPAGPAHSSYNKKSLER